MSYIDKSLGQGERVVARAHFHWWYTFKVIVLSLTVIGLFFSIPMMIRKWTTEIGVTTHRFVEKQGLFSLRTFEVALPNIEGVTLTQSLWGRILGYGHLRIEGTGVDHIDLPDIGDPFAFRAAIETAKSGNITR